MDLLLDIPSVLACDIIGKWLYLKDVVCLDSAFCHSAKRNVLHESVFQSPLCIVENVVELAVREWKGYGWNEPRPFDKSTFKWSATRGLKVRDLHFTAKSDCHVMNAYLQVHGHSVRSALCKDDKLYVDDESEDETDTSDAQLQVVTQCCPHLTSLELRGGAVSQRAIQQFHLGAKLSSISATDIIVVHSAVSSPDLATPLQCTTILLYCDHGNSEMRILSLCSPNLVRRLSVSQQHNLDWRTFTTLRALQWQGNLDRHTALTIFSQCKDITHLHCNFADETALDLAVTKLRRITSINLDEDCGEEALTDQALHQLALCHSGSLQALYMYESPHHAHPLVLSSSAINALLSRCTRLRTLSFKHVNGVDYSLLKSITTLTIGCPRPVAAWREIIHHCTSLETFNMVHTRQPGEVGVVKSYNSELDQRHFNHYHSVLRDMLWSTHLIVIAARMLTTLKTIVYYRGVMTDELRTALHEQAPNVLVVPGAGREWYNFSKLSIED